MAASGTPVVVTFTPPVAGTLKVIASLNAQGYFGSDWGVSRTVKTFCTQSGTTTYGTPSPLGNTRQAYSLVGLFSVAAGVKVTCGIWGGVSGAASMEIFAGANVIAEFTPT